MTFIEFDPVRMASAAGEMMQGARGLEAVSAQYGMAGARLGSQWTGDAATAYSARHAQWTTAEEVNRALLTRAATILAGTAQSFADLERRQEAAWRELG